MTTPLTKKDPPSSKARKEQAPRAQGSPASGERSEQQECKHEFDLVTHIKYPKKCLKCGREFPVKHTSEPRGQQQEWTRIKKQIWNGETLVGICISEEEADKTISAHNAELTGERRRRDQEIYETPPSDNCPTGIKWSDIAKWNGLACEENQKLLLSAQAAINEVKDIVKRNGVIPPVQLRELLFSVDLSTLHKHDAEVREPLVTALELVQLMFQRSDASDNFLGDDEHEAWTAVNKALAKVKEWK